MADTDKTEMKVKIMHNGPYIVSGGVPLTEQIIEVDEEGYSYNWRQGKTYPLQQQYALCRCGKSKNMPFCDGAHLKAGVDCSETAGHQPYIKQAEEIQGPILKLTDAQELCASARFCDRAGGIWNLVEQPDEEAEQIAIEEAGNCPSGRLIVWNREGKAIEPHFKPSIALIEDPSEGVKGPVWVRGGIPVESADGSVYEVRNRVTLCRCGRSFNKPFCNGSHMEEGL